MTERLRVALATCDQHPGFVANDDGALASALESIGIDAEPAIWTDPDIDWSAFDACLIRTTWDYMDRLPEFLDWMRRVERATPTFNSAATAEANLDKAYLRRLESAGVPVVDTAWARPAEQFDLPSLLETRGWEEVIIKPAIGAGASGLRRFTTEQQIDAAAHLRDLVAHGEAMIQPFLESIQQRGELSLVFIDGVFTHAVRKKPAERDFRVQIEFGGHYELEAPTPRAFEVARAALDGWPDEPLYARVDLVEPTPDHPAVIEVELVEPELFFPWAPAAGTTLGEALRRRLSERIPK